MKNKIIAGSISTAVVVVIIIILIGVYLKDDVENPLEKQAKNEVPIENVYESKDCGEKC